MNSETPMSFSYIAHLLISTTTCIAQFLSLSDDTPVISLCFAMILLQFLPVRLLASSFLIFLAQIEKINSKGNPKYNQPGGLLIQVTTNILPTPASVGHQRTESTSTGCNQWLSLAKIALKVPLAGRNRSLT
jgi:hypothetical protein